MRWNNLFDDLESQLEQELGAEEVDLRVEEERLRLGRLGVRDRLMSVHEASGGRDYTMRFEVGGDTLRIRPTGFGRDWLSGTVVDESSRRAQVIIPLRSIGSIILDRDQLTESLTPLPQMPAGRLADRLGITFVLRDFGRRRCAVDLVTALGTVHGTIDRVGRDHCDIAVHDPGTPRRDSAVTQYRIVPIDQLLLVRL
ncbi:MAG: hypothetical protein J0H56_06530 [Micrococcales bacterium]|nr:hypothetical protein [Micrococcales bacterium]